VPAFSALGIYCYNWGFMPSRLLLLRFAKDSPLVRSLILLAEIACLKIPCHRWQLYSQSV
jgi:hypothetical protein